MSSLVLKRANASRPSGQWKDEDYDVFADGKVVGAHPGGRLALWTAGASMVLVHHRDRAGDRVGLHGTSIEVKQNDHGTSAPKGCL
jgi:hypothetical protein